MLLLAHLARAEVPPSLKPDMATVLKRSPQFLDEMITIANLPRPPYGFGWLAPTIGCLEMAQCLTQALAIPVRKSLSDGASNKKVGLCLHQVALLSGAKRDPAFGECPFCVTPNVVQLSRGKNLQAGWQAYAGPLTPSHHKCIHEQSQHCCMPC